MLAIDALIHSMRSATPMISAIWRAAIIGFSYLGLVTALYAADHPEQVSRLALMGPMPPDHETASRYSPPERKVRSDSAAARFARARAGDGPSLVEAMTYRHSGHSRADPAQYRPKGELERWLERDPIKLYRERLVSLGFGEADLGTIERETEPSAAWCRT